MSMTATTAIVHIQVSVHLAVDNVIPNCQYQLLTPR